MGAVIEDMAFIRRLAFVLTIPMILCAGGGEAKKRLVSDRTLIVGMKEAPPFAMKADGAWTGISIDLWRQIADELGLKFEFRESDLQGLLDGVAKGSFDLAAAALTITSERENRGSLRSHEAAEQKE